MIFDCDGVLLDSEGLVCRIVAEELTRVGFPLTTEDVLRRFAGRPAIEMRAELETEFGRPIPEGFRPAVDRRTIESYKVELEIIPGVAEALEKIAVPVCVASSSAPEKLRLGLEQVGIYHYFENSMISSTSVPCGKPSPDIFLFAAGWMHADPARCVIVEDSIPGVKAAVRAGARVFGFTGGTHCSPDHGERLLAEGAERVFGDMRELPSLLNLV